jgi:MFS family permease
MPPTSASDHVKNASPAGVTTSMMVLSGLSAMGVAVHLMPYLTDIGHLHGAAALIISIISGLTVAGKIGLGLLADHRGVRPTIGLGYAVMLVGLVLLLNAQSFAGACAFAVVWGFAIGSPLLLNPTLTAECLGLKNFGAIFGVLTLFNTAGAAAGAVLSGVIYDSAGTYVPAFVLYIVLLAIAGVCGVMARQEYEKSGTSHENGQGE